MKAKRVGLVSIIALSLPLVAACQTLDGGLSLFGGGAAVAAESETPTEAEAEPKPALEVKESVEEAAPVVEAKASEETPVEVAEAEETKPKKRRFSLRKLFKSKEPEVAAVEAETEVVGAAAKLAENSAELAVAPMVRPVRKPTPEAMLIKTASTAAATATGKAVKDSLDEGPNTKTIVGLIRTYDAYRGDLAFAAQASFENKSAIREAHKRLAKYDEVTLSRAWIAYNASVAAQTPEFSGEINQKTKRGADRFLGSLHRKSGNVMKLRSSPKAVRSVLYNVSEETKQMSKMAAAYKQISVDLQTGKTTNVSMANEQANFIKAGYSGDMVLASKKTDLRIAKAVVTSRSRPVIGKMLILGAHITTNQSEGKYTRHTKQLSSHKSGQQCLKWARLNLAQCIAASRDTSEEAYCTGRHGINEVSECWSSVTLGSSGNPA